MKSKLIAATLGFSVLAFNACNRPAANSNEAAPANANTMRPNANGPIAAHNVPGGAGGPGGTKPTTGGMVGTPIDATKLDADIDKAEKAHQAKPNDAKATKALADAYFARAEALKDAQQYRAALGDYRKTVKLDPTNEPAQSMANQIISIMKQMGREVPEEGQEPPAIRK